MKRRSPNDNDQISLILETQEQLDSQSSESLEFFKLSQESLLEQRQAELKRLTVKYGRNNPRVQRLEAKVQQAGNVKRAVDVRMNIMKAQADPLPTDGWRIQGYVFNTDGEPLPGLTVMIGIKRDDNKETARAKAIDNSSLTVTNESGFYSITLTAEQLKAISQYSLYLYVLDNRKQIIFTSKDKLNPAPSTIDFLDATIQVAQGPTKPKGKTKGKGRGR